MSKTVETCFSCKVTSICCLSGIGGYLIYQAKQPLQRHKSSLILLGLGSIGLAVGEIFDRSPFRRSNKLTENE